MTWIINKKQDLLWLIGSVLMTYVLLSIYYGLNYFVDVSFVVASSVVYFIWIIVFDAPHIFATYTRTYFDKDFRQKNARLIYGVLSLFLIGPAYMFLFYTIGSKEQYRAAFLFFNRFGLLYAFYHLIRQHWGFVALYNRKSGHNSIFQIRLESILLWSGTIYPLIYHELYNYTPFGIAETKIGDISFQDWQFVGITMFAIAGFFLTLTSIFKKKPLASILLKVSSIFCIAAIVLFVTLYLGINKCLKELLFLSGSAFIIATILYISCLFYQKKEIKSSLPKLLLLVFILVTHNLVFRLNMPYMAAFACVTVFHNIQYHAIIRFHNKNKYLTDEKKYGWASNITKNVGLFVILAFSFNLINSLPREYIGSMNIDEIFIYFAAAFFWGVGFHHYVLDATIWRPSRDHEIKSNLNLSSVA